MSNLRRAVILAVAAAAWLPRAAAAQAPAIEVVTFEAAVQRAIASNLTVERASAAVLGAEALLAQARAAVRPTAGGTALASFDIVYIATGGGPGQTTTVPGLEVYRLAFAHRQVGLASALAIVLMVLVIVCILPIQWIMREPRK